MKLHEREVVVQKAKGKFVAEYYSEIEKLDIDFGEISNAFAQAILNLSLKKDEKKILDKHHEKLEEILEKTVGEFKLTYGETVNLLAVQISNNMKYLIRYERHGNFNEPGGFE